jgi:hypothetical protein
LDKIKEAVFSQHFRCLWDLVGAFAGRQSRLTEKLKNSALNMFLVVNEPEEQEFSLKKSKF